MQPEKGKSKKAKGKSEGKPTLIKVVSACLLPFTFLLLPFLDVFRFTPTTPATAQHREHDQQHEADEDDNDADFDRGDKKADERDELAQQRDDEQDDG